MRLIGCDCLPRSVWKVMSKKMESTSETSSKLPNEELACAAFMRHFPSDGKQVRTWRDGICFHQELITDVEPCVAFGVEMDIGD